MLPDSFQKWCTVDSYFTLWNESGEADSQLGGR
jgi:hypothetical protein